MWYNKYTTGCSTVGSARLLGSRGRRFKSCHPDHKNTSKKKVLTLSFLSIRSGLLFLRSKNKPQAQALEVTPQILVLRSKTNDLSPQSRNIWYNIYTSGCGAVGSAQRSGRWGRRFKSDHPDHILYMVIFISGVGAAVARTSGGREVASSILVPPTKFRLHPAILTSLKISLILISRGKL